MLKAIAIGNLGANAELKSANGSEFVTFRIAHNERWTGQDGQQHSNVSWIDCVMSGHPKVFEYLKAGQLVYVEGRMSLRVFSSAKERCMKAGMTINVTSCELLGSISDDIPRQLVDENGTLHNVTKWFLTDVKNTMLFSTKGGQFITDEQGWVRTREEVERIVQEAETANESHAAGNSNSMTDEPAQVEQDSPAGDTTAKKSSRSRK